jgi:hypothetical protein
MRKIFFAGCRALSTAGVDKKTLISGDFGFFTAFGQKDAQPNRNVRRLFFLLQARPLAEFAHFGTGG